MVVIFSITPRFAVRYLRNDLLLPNQKKKRPYFHYVQRQNSVLKKIIIERKENVTSTYWLKNMFVATSYKQV